MNRIYNYKKKKLRQKPITIQRFDFLISEIWKIINRSIRVSIFNNRKKKDFKWGKQIETE